MMDRACADSPKIVTKLVRATMEEMQYFLSTNAKIINRTKILHLVRDPRGRISSVLKLGGGWKFNYRKDSIKLCNRQMKDIEIRKELEKRYPNMFMEIRYEDVAANPIEMANRIYQFAYAEDVPESVKEWIHNSTQNGSTAEQDFGTQRKNSTATSTAWKTKLSREKRQSIETDCKGLIEYFDSNPH